MFRFGRFIRLFGFDRFVFRQIHLVNHQFLAVIVRYRNDIFPFKYSKVEFSVLARNQHNAASVVCARKFRFHELGAVIPAFANVRYRHRLFPFPYYRVENINVRMLVGIFRLIRIFGFIGFGRFVGLFRIGRRIGIFFDIAVVAAHYKIRNIVIITLFAGVFRVADFSFFRFYDSLFIVVSCGFYIVGNVSVCAILAGMYRITVRFARSSDRLYLVIVSDCFFAVHRIFVAAVFASINGVAVFRTGYGMFFGFIRVSRRGNVTVRIFITAIFAVMNGISAVRTSRFDQNFPEFMSVHLGIIIGVGIAAKVAGIFRIPFRSASAFHHLFRVFVRTLGYGFLLALVCKRGSSARADKRTHTHRQH